jgi:hypothetical protein
LVEGRVERRVRLQFPATENAAGVVLLQLAGIDAFDAERFE